MGVTQWMHCERPADYHSLGLTRIRYSLKVTPLPTLIRSRIKDSANVTLTPGDGTRAIKVESLA